MDTTQKSQFLTITPSSEKRFMKQSRGTNASVGIAAAYFLDNTNQVVFKNFKEFGFE
jgi:hypothetical protein